MTRLRICKACGHGKFEQILAGAIYLASLPARKAAENA